MYAHSKENPASLHTSLLREHIFRTRIAVPCQKQLVLLCCNFFFYSSITSPKISNFLNQSSCWLKYKYNLFLDYVDHVNMYKSLHSFSGKQILERIFLTNACHIKIYCNMSDFKLSCRMVSFTAWKTNFIFSVSIAVVKWWNNAFDLSRRRLSNICNIKF